MLIDLKNIKHSFSSDRVIDIERLQIDQHSFVFKAAKSGKTTLASIISGLLKPQDGEVFISGKNIYLMLPKEKDSFCADNIGVIWQDDLLIPNVSLSDNIKIVRGLNKTSLSMSEISAIIELFGLKDSLKKEANKLSDVEERLAAILRAMINKPKFIVADDLTATLNDRSALHVCDLCLKAADMTNVTIVNITDDERVREKFKQQMNL